jgi:hypothetical protein
MVSVDSAKYRKRTTHETHADTGRGFRSLEEI